MVLLLLRCKFPVYPFGKVMGDVVGVGVAAVVKLYYYLKWDQPQKLRGKNIAGTPIMFFTNLLSCFSDRH